jgi:tight adherence protein C
MSLSVAGAGLGVLLACGLLQALAASPPMRRTRVLCARLAPYLRDTSRPSRLLDDARSLTPFPTLEHLLAPILRDLAGWVDRVVGGSASVRRRLDHSGGETSVEQFRVEQVAWGAAGLAIGLLLAVHAASTGSRRNPLAYLALAGVLAMTGMVLRDRRLTAEVGRRETRIRAEFPTVAELLALAVGAGEGPVGALERVTRIAHGELSRDLDRVLSTVRVGGAVTVALDELAARTSLPMLARFAEGMAVAVERGTPLADVLRAQAADVREESRRVVLEAAGRKEIGMLMPVVFLVLPITVLIALFPGYYGLHLAVP